MLRDTLASLARCDPRPAEILVVDQSEETVSDAVVDEVGLPGARVVPMRQRGRARAFNAGLKNAAYPIVLVVDDDCTVRTDWVAVASRAMQEEPEGIVCGRVLPPAGADPRRVPSTFLRETTLDYTGDLYRGALYAGNMACPRDAVLAMGGFDERIGPFASDSEFCFRWLRAGKRLRHLPDLVVWHQDWRDPDELIRLYVDYYRGMGVFYAKYLAARDLIVLRMLLGDCYQALRSLYAGYVRGVERWADERRGAFRGLPRGLLEGWRQFRPSGPSNSATHGED
jgi:GT2 family glycosyltransferase